MNTHTPLTGDRWRAFSLVELLVVLSIISLLVALLLPALQSARAAARTAQCLSNKRQIGIAMSAYANDWDYQIPGGSARFGPGSAGTRWWYMFYLVNQSDGRFSEYPYMSDPGAAVCPEARTVNGSPFNGAYGMYNASQESLTTDGEFWVQNPWGTGQWQGMLLDKIPDPSLLLAMTCTLGWNGTGPFGNGHESFSHTKGNSPTNAVWLVHGGATTGLFMDSHVETLRAEELLNVANANYIQGARTGQTGIRDWFEEDGTLVQTP